MENEIDKLLEERGKVHGDAKTTHDLAYNLYLHACGDEYECSEDELCKLTDASKAMMFLIMVKIARGVQHPEHADHWKDIAGYARLIEKQECATTDAVNILKRHYDKSESCYKCRAEIIFHQDRITRWVTTKGYLCENCSL